MHDPIKYNPKATTVGDIYGPAMKITEQAEADEYLLSLVACKAAREGITMRQAMSMARQNLGYYAGYHDEGTRRRVEELFHCSHPVFGSIEPTPGEAFEMGRGATTGRVSAAKINESAMPSGDAT